MVLKNKWENEPDKVEFVFQGYKCLILRMPDMKHLCGYVEVPKSHPWHCVTYNDKDISPECCISIHGGLTFSGIPNGAGDGWWFGFDCAHAGDLVPGYARFAFLLSGEYRDIAYVRKETECLVDQLQKIAEEKES